MKNDAYSLIAERIREQDQILLFPHVNMDGDALGSTVGLCLALRKMGKEAWILTTEDVPKYLDFLDNGCITHDMNIFEEPGLAILVDNGSISRIPGREDVFNRARERAVIDHHGVIENDTEFDFGRVEPDSAATSEMVWMLIRELGIEVDLPIARAIYAAISTDTGSFQHSNTTKRTHEIASTFFDIEGFDCKEISVLLYNRNSLASMKLESKIVDSIHSYADGQIAISRVTQQMLQETGCDMSESESAVQKLMGIDGVEVGCMLKEKVPGEIRVSLRAKAFANVGEVAASFGGGGHARAAGCTIVGDIEHAEEVISAALAAEIARAQ